MWRSGGCTNINVRGNTNSGRSVGGGWGTCRCCGPERHTVIRVASIRSILGMSRMCRMNKITIIRHKLCTTYFGLQQSHLLLLLGAWGMRTNAGIRFHSSTAFTQYFCFALFISRSYNKLLILRDFTYAFHPLPSPNQISASLSLHTLVVNGRAKRNCRQ